MLRDAAVVDTNVLVYATFLDAPQHARSLALLQTTQLSAPKLCITTQIIAEYFAIVTSARRVTIPRSPQDAVGAICAFLALPGM